MGTKITRRYTDQRTKEWRIYGDFLDKFLHDSDIINANAQDFNVHTVFWDKPAAIAALFALEGDADGMLRTTRNERVQAAIPLTREKLKEVQNKWESYCSQKVNAGFDTPTEWPIELLTVRCKLEARLDCYLREAEYIKQFLQKQNDKTQAVAKSKILMYGPIGSGRLHDGEICEIDFQQVERVNNLLIITEASSPYRGMQVSDYRKCVVQPYKDACNEHMATLQQQRKKEIEQQGFSKIGVAQRRTIRVDPSALPKWPLGVANYLIEATHKM